MCAVWSIRADLEANASRDISHRHAFWISVFSQVRGPLEEQVRHVIHYCCKTMGSALIDSIGRFCNLAYHHAQLGTVPADARRGIDRDSHIGRGAGFSKVGEVEHAPSSDTRRSLLSWPVGLASLLDPFVSCFACRVSLSGRPVLRSQSRWVPEHLPRKPALL
jgi:hypothetical protein